VYSRKQDQRQLGQRGAAGSHSEPTAWRGDPLPRGRHKVSRTLVRESQRERLLQGMLQCVAANGYAATTVQKVAALARVSPNSFYTFFSDKADCFLALCDDLAEALLGQMITVGVAEEDWLDAARKGVRVYLNWWRDRPEITSAYCVELAAAGKAALEQRHRTYERYEETFLGLAARARAEQRDLPPVSRVAIRVLIAGLTELVGEEVRAGRLDRILELEPEVVRLLVRTLADDASAERAAAATGKE
jgi:AcrR family transcriptional regulator